MTCPSADNLYRSMAGALSPEQEATLATHLTRCESCARLQREVVDLGSRLEIEPSELATRDLAGEVMTLIRLGRAEPRAVASPWRWKAWLALPAAALACAAVLLAVPRLSLDPRGGELQARGAAATGAGLSRFVSIEAFRVAGPSDHRPLGAEMRFDDAVAFRYLNRAPEEGLRFLMIFAVGPSTPPRTGGAGRLYWYYPAEGGPGERPRSIPIAGGPMPRDLPEAVRHDLLPGPLRFFALFTPEPLEASEVARRVESDLALAGGRVERLERLRLEGAGQHTFLVEVLDRPAPQP